MISYSSHLPTQSLTKAEEFNAILVAPRHLDLELSRVATSLLVCFTQLRRFSSMAQPVGLDGTRNHLRSRGGIRQHHEPVVSILAVFSFETFSYIVLATTTVPLPALCDFKGSLGRGSASYVPTYAVGRASNA